MCKLLQLLLIIISCLSNIQIAQADGTASSQQLQHFIFKRILIELDHGLETISGDYRIILKQVLSPGEFIYQNRAGYQPEIKLTNLNNETILYTLNSSSSTETINGDPIWKTKFIYELTIPATEINRMDLSERPVNLNLRIIYPICSDYCINEVLETPLTLSVNQSAPASIVKIQPTEIHAITNPNHNSLALMVFFAWLGGLILNFMPCVFPVLSIKIMSVVKLSNKRKHSSLALIAASTGIVISLTILGWVTSLLHQAGKIAGWGMHFQNIYLLLFLAIVIAIFAANFVELMHLNYTPIISFLDRYLPFGAGHSKQQQLKLNLILEHFFSGITIVLLSTPCSAPFISIATSFALMHPGYIILPIFIAIGVGLATPYLLLLMFPKLFNLFPKPGKWLYTMQRLMGIILFFTLIWLLNLVCQLSNWIICLKLAILLMMLINYQQLIKLLHFHTPKHQQLANKLLFVFLISCIALLPSTSRYSQQSSVAINKQWQSLQPELITQLIQEQHVVLVNITADWCVTCGLNEQAVFKNQTFTKFLQSHPEIIRMRGDLTTSDPVVNEYLRQRQRFAIPYTVVYSNSHPTGIVLPDLLNTDSLIQTLQQELNYGS